MAGENAEMPVTPVERTNDGVRWTYRLAGSSAILTGYEGVQPVGEVTLPSQMDGYPVTAVGAEAFEFDEEHALTLSEVVSKLRLYGVEAERKSPV